MTNMTSIFDRYFSLHGKTALVTGASGGIGRAFSLALAGAGAVVAIHGRAEDRLEETRRRIEEAGGRCVPLIAELAEVEACRRLIQEAHEALGRLDVLVNNAGMNRRKPLSEFTQDDYDMIMAANLRSAFVLGQAAYPIMKAQGGGKIVHVGSITSSYGLGGVGVYGLSKSALAHLTKTMAVEWARDNIQVNCLAPGFIVTPLTETALWGHEGRRSWLLERIPARRGGEPDDLVGCLLLLASPASNYLTGQLITVDGGFLAGGWWRDRE
jgi:gluconate 5-dehydrogenase